MGLGGGHHPDEPRLGAPWVFSCPDGAQRRRAEPALVSEAWEHRGNPAWCLPGHPGAAPALPPLSAGAGGTQQTEGFGVPQELWVQNHGCEGVPRDRWGASGAGGLTEGCSLTRGRPVLAQPPLPAQKSLFSQGKRASTAMPGTLLGCYHASLGAKTQRAITALRVTLCHRLWLRVSSSPKIHPPKPRHPRSMGPCRGFAARGLLG